MLLGYAALFQSAVVYNVFCSKVPFYLDLVLNDAQPNSINFYNMNTDLVGYAKEYRI